MMVGSCHCGKISIHVAKRPDYLNDCNCSLCSKLGVIWGYVDAADVQIDGETGSYTRHDRDKPGVRVHFCAQCGCTSHWSPMPHIPQDRMGINVRLFAASDLTGLVLHYSDGAGWDGMTPYGFRQESTVMP